ncbi:hypothetical protein [Chloroherpeton thalassium]|nr:hypothetical protein [Chloroherpeton thalassium]
MITHFPIFGTLIGSAFLAYGIFSKQDAIKQASFVLIILIALATVPVLISGSGAADAFAPFVGELDRQIIKEHKELAEKTLWLSALMGGLSLASFITLLKKNNLAYALSITTLLITLITFGAFSKVGNLGGQIRHTEIRHMPQTDTNQTGDHNESANDQHESAH